MEEQETCEISKPPYFEIYLSQREYVVLSCTHDTMSVVGTISYVGNEEYCLGVPEFAESEFRLELSLIHRTNSPCSNLQLVMYLLHRMSKMWTQQKFHKEKWASLEED